MVDSDEQTPLDIARQNFINCLKGKNDAIQKRKDFLQELASGERGKTITDEKLKETLYNRNVDVMNAVDKFQHAKIERFISQELYDWSREEGYNILMYHRFGSGGPIGLHSIQHVDMFVNDFFFKTPARCLNVFYGKKIDLVYLRPPNRSCDTSNVTCFSDKIKASFSDSSFQVSTDKNSKWKTCDLYSVFVVYQIPLKYSFKRPEKLEIVRGGGTIPATLVHVMTELAEKDSLQSSTNTVITLRPENPLLRTPLGFVVSTRKGDRDEHEVWSMDDNLKRYTRETDPVQEMQQCKKDVDDSLAALVHAREVMRKKKVQTNPYSV